MMDTGEELQQRKRPQPGFADMGLDNGLDYDPDRARLQQLGKKQVLKRNFGFMSMLGFSCTIMVTWEGMCAVFTQGFSNGGTAGLIYGFILVWIGTICLFTTLGELASMAPTAGGQYYWVALLAPKSSRRFLSYVTGWLTVTGWQALVASGGYLVGTQIQGLVILNRQDYNATGWQGTLLYWAAILIAVVFNTVISSALPKIEGLILLIHTLGFVAIMIPIVDLAPRAAAEEVFTTFLNEGNWSTQGLSFFVGISGVAFAFLGTDAAIHVSRRRARPMFTVLLLTRCLRCPKRFRTPRWSCHAVCWSASSSMGSWALECSSLSSFLSAI